VRRATVGQKSGLPRFISVIITSPRVSIQGIRLGATLATHMIHKAMQSDCVHDYRLESGGGPYLTGAYVCRFCSFRISMSDEQFRKHADRPDYQANSTYRETESVEEDPRATARDSFPRIPPACLLASQIESLIEICCLGI
jgi:hypothetical protein